MSEVNPDPVAKLAKFTPAGGPDAAELLFAAGRASARTHRGWKLAVAGLVASNLVMGALFALRIPAARPAPRAEPAPVVPAPPEVPPAVPKSEPAPADDPSSYRVLLGSNLDGPPRIEPVPNLTPGREPLTVLAGRRGELD